MTAPVPPRYRRLLITYPRAWRREHEQVVLGIQLEADAARGAARPSLRDRLAFLAGGVVERLPHRDRAARSTAHPLFIGDGWHLFDQGNGADPESTRTTAEQIRQNAVLDRNTDGERVAGMAPMGMLGGAGGSGLH